MSSTSDVDVLLLQEMHAKLNDNNPAVFVYFDII